MPQLSIVEPLILRKETKETRTGAITKLAQLHAEAEETARLANLLGRSLYAAIAMPLLAVLTVGLAQSVDLARQLVWCAFVAAASIAILVAYARAIRRPFDRESLKHFAKDISAILLFAGFAWGAGGFLAMPPGSGAVAAISFAIAPSILIAALLRERDAIFLFLAPVATLASFASVLRPFADGALDAGLIVIACGGLAGAVALMERRHALPAMLPQA